MGMGFPMGMGIDDRIGNRNGKEWETTFLGMGMTLIPMGFPSAYVTVIYSLLYNGNSLYLSPVSTNSLLFLHINMQNCRYDSSAFDDNAIPLRNF